MNVLRPYNTASGEKLDVNQNAVSGMSEADPPLALPKPRRRWYQFSLRTLLIFVTLFVRSRAVGWA